MEFRKGVLFVRLHGSFNDDAINDFNDKVIEVIVISGIKYVVLNISDLNMLSYNAIKEIKKLKKILSKLGGKLFLFGGNFKELKTLVNLENELNVFEKVVI